LSMQISTKPRHISKSFLYLLVGIYFSLLFFVSRPVLAASNNSATAVMVYYSYTGNDGKAYSNIRTGIPVGNGEKTKYILTDGTDLDTKLSVRPNSGNAVNASIIWVSKEKDFAILQLASEINVKPVTFSLIASSLKSVIKVYSIGYPVVNGQVPKNMTFINGSLTDIGDENGYRYYKTDVELSAGYTGGPLFNEDGCVVGMNFSRAEFKGYGLAIQTEQLLPLLDQQGIKYLVQKSSGPQSVPQNTPQTKPQTPPQNAPQTKPQPTPQSKPSSSEDALTGIIALVIILIIGLVVIGLIVGVVIFIIKKSKGPRVLKVPYGKYAPPQGGYNPQLTGQFTPPQQPYQQQVPFTAPQGTTPILRCISGVFNGNRMELNNQPVQIGKDPRFCQIVYPSSDNTVSDQHCVIRYNSSGHIFILEDVGSLQGTYLVSGERVLPGTPKNLKSGDRFFIGNPQNLFEIVIE
jgi:hypothetical protein